MKLGFFTFTLIIVSSIIFAQSTSESIKLKWNNSSESGNSYSNWHFEGSKDLGMSGLIPFFCKEIEIESDQILDMVYLSDILENGLITDSDDYEIVKKELSNDYNIQVIYDQDTDSKTAKIMFPAISISELPNVLNQLASFTLNFTITDSQTEIIKSKTITFANSSVMSSGLWYQFKLSKSGIYKISYEQLSEAGIDVSSFSASQIKMYGFGGMLPESNDAFRYSDIPEIAIQMEDGGDNSFDPGDYLIFYAQGPDTWSYNSFGNEFRHHTNIYDRQSYYYLVLSDGNGKRISSEINSQTPDVSVNSFFDYDFIEDETYNLINSGRRWFGDKFEFTTDYQYNFSFDHIKNNSEIKIKTVVAARSNKSSRFTVSALGKSDIISIPSIPTGSYPSYAVGGQSDLVMNATGQNQNINIDINYNQPLSGSVGWLDYIEILVERDLIYDNGQMAFRNPETIADGQNTEFVVQNNSGSNPQIWDITEITNPGLIDYQSTSNQLKFTSATSSIKEFIVFDNASYQKATFVKAIPNQNLHAELNHDYIIITHPDFLDQAQELADFHRNYSNLDVYVTTLEPIYHEFSSGKQDVSAIRDFVRAVYNNSDNNKKLQYLLLFGDASMDYLNREENNTNMVPTWETYESFNPISSIATDDYFGFLEDDEGDFIFDDIDVGIGRFPVVTASEAQAMLDKIKHYKSNNKTVMSDWRNIICFIADDEDNNLHIRQSNELSQLVDTIYPVANLDKIFADAYTQESTPAGQRYPKVNEAINERVDKGALIIGYTGHGGEVGWGQERFLDIPDINSWTNYDKLPVFLTATCEFARYDDPDRVSAGELIFLNDEGGGISLFTTSRATYAGSNFTVSKNFYKNALRKTDGVYPTMGEVLKLAKLATGSGQSIGNVNKFVLLGDPALSMNIPEQNIEITSILNNGSNTETDTIQALSNLTISGEIRDENNQIIKNFNGVVYPTIYDKPSTIYSLGNDSGSSPFEFQLQNNVLYKGLANVRDGEFEFTFIVPKDIAYKYGNGKISLYAENGDIDAAGFTRDIIVGGYDEYSSEDDNGPRIELFINNTNFVNGGITDENPVLLAFVQDENGINTTGNGIGHDISSTLDSDPNNVKILNDYYVADANSYKSGIISFPYFDLEDGSHTLELKVWDIHNNSSKASIDFVVTSSGSIALNELFNYPNPVMDYTTFSFEHNQSGEEMDVSIDIYSMDGKRVTRLENTFIADSYRNNEIKWDLTDQNGSKIAKGIYLYKVLIKLADGKEATKTSKLVVVK